MNRKIVLNAGCGSALAGTAHVGFSRAGWSEVRLDIDPGVRPDIVASLCDMGLSVSDGAVDAIWSSHTVEHLHAHEVVPAFSEMQRVLKPGGFALITCPNLTAIAKLAATGDIESVVYDSPAGPIRAIDMLFGHGPSIAEGHLNMAHNTGFTASRLARVALAAGFAEVRAMEGPSFDLWAVLLTPGANIEALAAMFAGTNVATLFAPNPIRSDEAEVRRVAGAR